MSNCSSLPDVVTNVYCQQKLKPLIYTDIVLMCALFCYLLTLIALSIFKHKVYGFTLKLLILLEMCLAFNIIPCVTIIWILEAKLLG